MTWSDVERTGGVNAQDDMFEPTTQATPFAAQRRRRLFIMALVLGGGCLTIVGMRLYSGGPTTAVAADDAVETISAYLAPDQERLAADIPVDDPLVVLARCAEPPDHVPVEDLKSNPFLLPGGLSALPTVPSHTSQENLRETRREQMEQQVQAMRVSMVLQGRHSVAVVGDVTLPLEHPIEYQPNLTLTLLSISNGQVRLRATDPLADTSITLDLPRP